ncbi:four-helix bundle copper-binding protein [Pseudocnuella soli]|uniref:four-helix bundle copper-binding protein n=1 Tax=Pseudocnuella soli TaxID=2502779 RepID=UPI001049DDC1|nr:four-helix bundle copper-binding protein [Pseudocnuella soli]
MQSNYQQYQSCIDACLRCASACQNCASSCLQEEHLHMMAKCIQLDMECAALCYAAAQLMSLGSDRAKELYRICADACEACAAECSQHQHDHCQQCAQACRACVEECRRMAA